jgi:signal peptidase I
MLGNICAIPMPPDQPSETSTEDLKNQSTHPDLKGESKTLGNSLPMENLKGKSTSSDLKEKGGWRKTINNNLPTVVVAILMAVGVRTFVAEPRYIPSSSMEPTLQIEDKLLIDKLTYKWRSPERGEIIVFNPPNHPAVQDTSKVYIKRVIGLPGDQIGIHDGKVFVNGKPLTEPYIASPPSYSLPSDLSQCPDCFRPSQVSVVNKQITFTVPPKHYWMMGDNRNNSQDSHIWGFLPEENIVGRAFFRYWPIDNRAGGLNVPSYVTPSNPATK